MRRWWVLAVMSVVVASCGDAGSDSESDRRVVGIDDRGAEIELAVGDEFELRLESNPTTGYRWQVAEQPDAVTLVDDGFEEPDTDLVGAPGVEYFVFRGAAAGSGDLRMEYVRSFDDPPVPAETAEYRLLVTDS
jgi:inhibitor of cysteine peptidase